MLLANLLGSLSLLLGGYAKDPEEQRKLLQQAQQLALQSLDSSRTLSSIEVIESTGLQPDVKETESIANLSEEFQVCAEAVVASLAKVEVQIAIAANFKQRSLLQETYELVLQLVDINRELWAIQQKFLLKPNTFQTIHTKIKNHQLLILTLEQMGLTVALEAEVRGENGQRVKADIVAALGGGFDIGWSRSADGSFDMVLHLWGVIRTHGPELINSINNQYLLNASPTYKFLPKGGYFSTIGAGSGYFSTIRTKIRNLQLLKLTLEQLGLRVELEADIRGGSGQKVKADVVAVLDGDYDIGWLRTEDGSVVMIADLNAMAEYRNHVIELINSINCQYQQNVENQ